MTVRGKGGKIRNVPLDHRILVGRNYPSLKNYIEHWRLSTHSTALFTTKKGEMTPQFLRKIIKEIGKKAGVTWIHPHALRHFCATNLLRAGVNLKIVQEILGHEKLSTTEIYLHLTERDIVKAMQIANIEDPILKKSMKPKKWGVLVEKTDGAKNGPGGI